MRLDVETLHVEPASSRLIEETGFKKPVFSQQNTGANQGISGFTIRQDYLLTGKALVHSTSYF